MPTGLATRSDLGEVVSLSVDMRAMTRLCFFDVSTASKGFNRRSARSERHAEAFFFFLGSHAALLTRCMQSMCISAF